MSYSRKCFITFPNTSTFAKNSPLRVVFQLSFKILLTQPKIPVLFLEISRGEWNGFSDMYRRKDNLARSNFRSIWLCSRNFPLNDSPPRILTIAGFSKVAEFLVEWKARETTNCKRQFSLQYLWLDPAADLRWQAWQAIGAFRGLWSIQDDVGKPLSHNS